MSARLSGGDHLSGVTPAAYPRRPTGTTQENDSSSKLSELKVEVSYLRRDVDELREFAKDARDSFASMEGKLGRLEERGSHLPTYKEMFLTMSILLTVFAAIIIFADRLKVLMHLQ